MMKRHLLVPMLASLVLSAALLVTPSPLVRGAADPGVAVKGQTTTWQLSLLHIRSMYSIPRTALRTCTVKCRIFVLTVRLTNTGRRAAAPFDDLMLTLRVRPPYHTVYFSGFTSIGHNALFTNTYYAVAHTYGGVPPWQVTRPGQTTTYCYIIVGIRGDSHYGLYNFVPYKGMVYLLDTGI